jgi:pimeloyl-ACP methyl ester carboxylesterase
MGVYPFMFSSIKDFLPIVSSLTSAGLAEPYDWDEYASHFFPKAEELTARATEAESAGEKDKASELFLRASAVYRIARFPTPRSPLQKKAWTEGKKVFYKGAGMLEFPITEVQVPHTHKATNDIGDTVFVNKCIPPGASAESPVPTVLIITGLDGYRTELAVWQKGWAQKGCASVIVEIPGTGDSPAAPGDVESPDRQFSSLLDWMDTQKELDSKRVVVWGFSTGGYYAIRLAHTHKDRLLAVVSLGGGAHHMFEREWLENVNRLEYPFDLAGSLCYKFGYGTDLEKFISEAGKFSLLTDGTLSKPCTRLLLVNGNDDEIFPVDDMYVCLENGAPKEARFVKGKKHMGEPDSFFIILTWIYGVLGIKGHWGPQMGTLPSKPQFD